LPPQRQARVRAPRLIARARRAALIGTGSSDLGVHAVVHLAGDGLELAELIVPGGRIASTLGLTADTFAGHDVVAIPIMASPIAATLERLADEVVAGRLRVPIQGTYTLEQVPQAFADYSAGSRGKLSVQVS
jgi:NADPH:quinone reductase-like Zn-dependent oxidoreductase